MCPGQDMLFDKEDKRAGKYYRSRYRCPDNTNGTQSQSHSQASSTFLDTVWKVWMDDEIGKWWWWPTNKTQILTFFQMQQWLHIKNQKKTYSRLCIWNISIDWLSRWSGCKLQDEKIVLILWSSPPPRIYARRALRIRIARARLVTHTGRVLTRVWGWR